jgi:8-oxo-dGTP pyrophosphatase MutT (NUDIX family)
MGEFKYIENDYNITNRLVLSTPFYVKSTVSYGLIVFAVKTQRWVLIQRKHSVEFLLVITGSYRISYLRLLLQAITSNELSIINQCINNDDDYFKNLYINILQLNINGFDYALLRLNENRTILKKITSNITINIINTLSWNWPKGRLSFKMPEFLKDARSDMETHIECAKREFLEEVEIILPQPIYISDTYISSTIKTINFRNIESRFWIYIISEEIPITPPTNNIEVIARDWFDTAQSKILLNNDVFFNNILSHIITNTPYIVNTIL